MSEQCSNKGIKDIEPQDRLYLELRRCLLVSFERAGYGYEECIRLADIAIGPIQSTVNLAHEAYKLYVEKLTESLPTSIWIRGE